MGSNDELLFTTIDKRGIFVACLKSQWEKHIVVTHPEVADSAKQVEQAIFDPDIIIQSEEYNNRDVYFKKMNEENEHMKVIVEVSQNYGEVVTAFPRRGVGGNVDMEVVHYVRPQL